MTLADYAATWLRRRRTALRATTRQQYDIYSGHLVRLLGDVAMVALRAADVMRLAERLQAEDYSGATIHMLLWLLDRMYRDAIREDLLTANPAADAARLWAPPRRRGTPIAWSHLPRVLDALGGDPMADALLFQLYTGTRVGEVLALQWRDLDLERGAAAIERTWHDGTTTPPKGGRHRRVELVADAVALLSAREAASRTAWVWTDGDRTQPWTRRAVQQRFQRALAAAGLPAGLYTPHALRHTFATTMLELGASLEWVQQQMGHASVGITRDLYGRTARIARPVAALDAWNRRLHRFGPLRASGPAPADHSVAGGRRR